MRKRLMLRCALRLGACMVGDKNHAIEPALRSILPISAR